MMKPYLFGATLLLCYASHAYCGQPQRPAPMPTPVAEAEADDFDRVASRPGLPSRGDSVRAATEAPPAPVVETEAVTDPPLPPSADEPQPRRRPLAGVRSDLRQDIRGLRTNLRNATGNTAPVNTGCTACQTQQACPCQMQACPCQTQACPCQAQGACPCQACQNGVCQGLFSNTYVGANVYNGSSVTFGRSVPSTGILAPNANVNIQRFNPVFENGYESQSFNGGCSARNNVEATCAAIAQESVEPTCAAAAAETQDGCCGRFTVGCGAAPGARGIFAGGNGCGCHDLLEGRAGYSAGTFDLAYLRSANYSALRSHAEFDAPWGIDYLHELHWYGQPDMNADLQSFDAKFTLLKELEFTQGGHSPLHFAFQYEDTSAMPGSARIGGGVGIHRLLPHVLADRGVRADINFYATSDVSDMRIEYLWYVPLLGDNVFYRGWVDQDIMPNGAQQHVDQSHQLAVHLFAGIHAMGEYYSDNTVGVHEWRYGVQWMAWFK